MWPLRLDVFISKGRHSSTFYWISQDEGFEWRSTLHQGNLYLAWHDGWVKDSGANKWRWGWTCPFGGEVVWGELSMMQISRINFDIISYESLNCDQLGAILAGFLLFCFFCIIQDPNSIIFTADLHIKFPVNIFDVVRKVTFHMVPTF